MHHTMKIVYLTLLAVVLIGCRTASLAYSGGDGSSYAQAIVIKGAKDEEAGVAAERAWLEQRYPGFDKGRQSLMSSDGKNFDLIEFTTASGEHRSVYFDISDFFGK